MLNCVQNVGRDGVQQQRARLRAEKAWKQRVGCVDDGGRRAAPRSKCR